MPWYGRLIFGFCLLAALNGVANAHAASHSPQVSVRAVADELGYRLSVDPRVKYPPMVGDVSCWYPATDRYAFECDAYVTVSGATGTTEQDRVYGVKLDRRKPLDISYALIGITSAWTPVCHEDQKCWNWRTMGNHCRGTGKNRQCAP